MSVRSMLCWVLALVVSAFAGAAHAGEGVVALQTADPSCADDSGYRYVDCENGTMTDNETGLVWLKNADCFGQLTWHEAIAAVGGLGDLPEGSCGPSVDRDDCDCGLSDGSSPGEWRLPSMGEWKAMVSPTCREPALSDDQGTGCWNSPCDQGSTCSFYGVQSEWYWSSSSYVPSPTSAWDMSLNFGSPDLLDKGFTDYVWPVRGGQ